MTNAVEQLTLNEKLNLIKTRARLLGFRRHDLEDAVQEVMLTVLEFVYDFEKSNGATEATALTTVIDRKLIDLKRTKRCYAGLLDRATEQLASDHQGYFDGPCVNDQSGEKRIVSAEVEAVIAKMGDEMQQVCRLLMDGMQTRGIARRLKMGWNRADELVTAIRERFEEAGLNPIEVE